MAELKDSARVLVVDDDENVLRLLAIKLRRAGFAVDLAADAASAIGAARAAPPDLVVLGDGLPDGDVHALVARLAAGGQWAGTEDGQRAGTPGGRPGGTAVVLLSTRAGSDAITRGLEAGAEDYVLKPFSPDELIHRLRVVLARRGLGAVAPGAGTSRP